MLSSLEGQEFGQLTVIRFLEIGERKSKGNIWLCQCSCGNYTQSTTGNLRGGRHKSCGCTRYAYYSISKKGKNSGGWKGYEDLPHSYYTRVQRRAKTISVEFDLTIEYLWDLFIKQNKRCALSDVELTFNRLSYSTGGTASLDRINSSLGYIIGNVQWIHKDVNKMKYIYSNEYFIQTCIAVSRKIEAECASIVL